jgi:hypothetical protein
MYTGHHWLYLNISEGNLNSFIPAWATYRGILATPNIVLTPEARRTHLGLTPHLIRLFRNKDELALRKEIALEMIRRIEYPHAISRLNCIYCWPDEATAKIAPRYWSNQGAHFHEKYLVEIGVTGDRNPSIHDTRWIDRFVILSQEPLETIDSDWIHEYWRGSIYPWNNESDVPSVPLLECLVEGTALIWTNTLKMEAYSIVERIAPLSVGILEKGRLGVDLCARFGGKDEWRLGQLASVLVSDQGREDVWVRNIIHLEDSLAATINENVVKYIKADEINRKALSVFEKDSIAVPDLRAVEVNLGWIKASQKYLKF